jgi:type VII secretion-associated serine protease mycosin
MRAATDLIRSREWPLPALHIPQAWRWSKGAGVTVAVLDTGVDGRHPDLTGRVIQGPDYTGRGRRPGNRYWGRHGTAMASIIAGHGHGPGRAAGVMGVAPQAKILSIRVTWENDDPERSDRAQVSRTRDAVAKGIRYAVDHGAQVINMSLGGGKLIYNGNPVEADAVRYALDKGAILIASAGNDGAGLNRTNYPAAYTGVTAVGAVDKTLRPARFTNRHDYVSVGAPGVDIISADAGRSYVQGTGTSPSAAIVAGIAALVRSRCPALTPDQTKQALEQGTTHRPPGGRNTKIGTGVADALRTMYAGDRICKAPPPSQGVRSQPQSGDAAMRAHASLPRIGVLGGGGLLLIVSLFMGWRQRRRHARAAYETADAHHEEPAERPLTDDALPIVDTHSSIADPPARGPAARAPKPPRPVPGLLAAPVALPEPIVGPEPVVRPEPVAGPEPAVRPGPVMPPERAVRPEPIVRPEPVLRHEPVVRPEPVALPEPVARPEPIVRPEPVTLPEPRRPAHPGPREYGDDPLGPGYVAPLYETSTPLADQSWEIVQRGRSSGTGEPSEPLDFPRFETRFRRPPDT